MWDSDFAVMFFWHGLLSKAGSTTQRTKKNPSWPEEANIVALKYNKVLELGAAQVVFWRLGACTFIYVLYLSIGK